MKAQHLLSVHRTLAAIIGEPDKVDVPVATLPPSAMKTDFESVS